MTTKSIPQITDDCEPHLHVADIPWGRHGMHVGIVVDVEDAETYRGMVREALAAIVTMTNKLRQAELVIGALRDENRTLRLRLAA